LKEKLKLSTIKAKGIHDLAPSQHYRREKGLLHIEEETRVRQEDSRKNTPF
jgi:hypothetical protein